MATLTKYDSFEALKANTGSGIENLAESDERHRTFEKFINLLQAQVSKSKPSNAIKNSKKRV
jgi:hypothetical protein